MQRRRRPGTELAQRCGVSNQRKQTKAMQLLQLQPCLCDKCITRVSGMGS